MKWRCICCIHLSLGIACVAWAEVTGKVVAVKTSPLLTEDERRCTCCTFRSDKPVSSFELSHVQNVYTCQILWNCWGLGSMASKHPSRWKMTDVPRSEATKTCQPCVVCYVYCTMLTFDWLDLLKSCDLCDLQKKMALQCHQCRYMLHGNWWLVRKEGLSSYSLREISALTQQPQRTAPAKPTTERQ